MIVMERITNEQAKFYLSDQRHQGNDRLEYMLEHGEWYLNDGELECAMHMTLVNSMPRRQAILTPNPNG